MTRSVIVSAAALALALLQPMMAEASTHAGSQDPVSEGWLLGGSHASVLVGPVAADPIYPGVAAWSIDDASTAASSTTFYAAPASEIPEAGQPWQLSARLRVVDLADAVDIGVFLEVTDQSQRRFLVTFGSDANGRSLLHLSNNGNTSGGPNAWTIQQIVSGAPMTEFLSLDLVSDGAAAELFVNGTSIASGLTGYVAGSVAPRVLWGAGGSASTGHGHYAYIHFALDPVVECANGIDDDGDGEVDHAGGDADCASPRDPQERPPVVPCDDGVDTDLDGVCDVDESRIGTSANDTDSDGDGLLDGDEISVHGTDPAAADSDGDGFPDGEELLAGRDPTDPTSGPAPEPAWDFAMPSRFVDRNPASAPALGDFYFSGPINPSTWRVVFDACATGGLVFEYRWSIDGVLIESRPTCGGFQYDFADEGLYDVELVAVGTGGEELVEAKTIEVQDLLIFGLGDSYASGEGNPDRPVTLQMIADYEETLDARDQAIADANAALAAWQAQLVIFDDLVGRIEFAYLRLGIWQDRVEERNEACSTFPFTGCAAAQLAASQAAADLIWALGNIGIPEPSNFTYSAIHAAITGVYNAGLATLTSFESALGIAQAAVVDTQQIVDATKAGLVPDWQSESCHRSAFSGQVLAAKRLEQSDPHTSVTFVHLACSGAKVRTGSGALIGDDGIASGATNNDYQVSAMRTLAAGREIDNVFLSIGGNDANFASTIESCVMTEPCYQPGWAVDVVAQAALDAVCATSGWFLDSCSIDYDIPELGENAATIFHAGKSQLAGRYASLHRWLEGEYPLTAAGELNTLGRLVDPARVLFTEYPDFMRGDSGDYCGWTPSDPTGGLVQNLPGVSRPEHVWASTVAALELQDEMQTAAEAHGWTFVRGISSPFETHGYCASDPWIVRIGESITSQRDPDGTVHPDRTGHVIYADALEAAAVPEPGLLSGIALSLPLLLAFRRGRRPRQFGTSPTGTAMMFHVRMLRPSVRS